MSIIDHGSWVGYKPKVPHENAPLNTIYAKRTSDGVDWYDYVKENFQEHSVKFAVRWDEAMQIFIVGPATRDATAIFPLGFIVYELEGFDGNDPFSVFNNKEFDPEKEEFRDIKWPEPRDENADLRARLEALEAKLDGYQGKR